MAAYLPVPCPVLVAGDLCWKQAGHRGPHEPAVPEISGRRLQRIRDRYFSPAWWQRRPRCPECRTVIQRIDHGELSGPLAVPTGEGHGPCVEVISEYPVWLSPCGCKFRRVMRDRGGR